MRLKKLISFFLSAVMFALSLSASSIPASAESDGVVPIVWDGTAAFKAGKSYYIEKTVTINKKVTIPATAELIVDSSTELVIGDKGSLIVKGELYVVRKAAVTVNGALEISKGGCMMVEGKLNALKTLKVSGELDLAPSSAATLSGTTTVEGFISTGEKSSVTVKGTLQVSKDGMMGVGGKFQLNTSKKLKVYGVLAFHKASAVTLNGKLTVYSTGSVRCDTDSVTTGKKYTVVNKGDINSDKIANPGTVKLTVKLLTEDFRFANNGETLCYPSVVSPTDIFGFKLVAKSGNVYESDEAFITQGGYDGAEIVFSHVKESDINSLTFKWSTLASTQLGDLKYYSYSYISEKYRYSSVPINKERTSKEIAQSSLDAMDKAQSLEELAAIVPEYTGDYSTVVDMTLAPSGLCSVLLAQMPDGKTFGTPVGSTAYDERETYGVKNIFDCKVTVGGKVCKSVYMYDGVVQFILPVDYKGNQFNCSGDIVVTTRGYWANTDVIYTAEYNFGEYYGYCLTADNNVQWLGINNEPVFDEEFIN